MRRSSELPSELAHATTSPDMVMWDSMWDSLCDRQPEAKTCGFPEVVRNLEDYLTANRETHRGDENGKCIVKSQTANGKTPLKTMISCGSYFSTRDVCTPAEEEEKIDYSVLPLERKNLFSDINEADETTEAAKCNKSDAAFHHNEAIKIRAQESHRTSEAAESSTCQMNSDTTGNLVIGENVGEQDRSRVEQLEEEVVRRVQGIVKENELLRKLLMGNTMKSSQVR